MKIAVFSDSHEQTSLMHKAVADEKPDVVIHLGDHASDVRELRAMYPQLPVYAVVGNCDFSLSGAEKLLLEFEGKKILAMHGHTHGVKSGLMNAVYAALEAQADVLLFGHTHVPLCDQRSGVLILNPGTIGKGKLKTYGIIEIENGIVKCKTAVAK